VLSHRSAAAHWGLLDTDQTRVEVTAPRGRHGAPGIRLHRSRSLDAQDTTEHRGINGHRGTTTLAAATAREPRWTRRELEARFLKLVRDAGLPEPEVNASFAALDHEPYEVDFYWPSYCLGVETDGWETHRTRSAFERDRRKDTALTATGDRVVRCTWRCDEREVLAHLRSLLA
jgi:very-short-patch-repair endonuclease